MYRTMSLAAAIAMTALQGCATSPQAQRTAPAFADSNGGAAPSGSLQQSASHHGPEIRVAQVTEVPVEPNAPDVAGHPLTSVVVTQCNLIVAVYMTMPDGRLLRFDHSAHVPPEQLMTMAYSATRSERVEVSCNNEGPQGYESHDPV